MKAMDKITPRLMGLHRMGKTGFTALALLGSGVFILLPLGLTAIGLYVVLARLSDLPILPWLPVVLVVLCIGLLTARIGRLLWRCKEYGPALTVMRRSQGANRLALLATVLTAVSSLLVVGLTHQQGGMADLAVCLLGSMLTGFVLGREVWRQIQGWREDFPPLSATLLAQIIDDFQDELRDWQEVDGPSLVGTRADLFRVQMLVVESYLEQYPELARHEAAIYHALGRSVGM